ncbi:MAG: CapA family protein [Treponemataceae bacterium]|nr:CapA family protein [Treponemataceae bacterium]
MNDLLRPFSIPLAALAAALMFGCASIPKTPAQEQDEAGRPPVQEEQTPDVPPQAAEDTVTLLFAGDIMAHTPNFAMKDYARIWEDIAPIVQGADFAFANIEAPVDDSRPFSTYPNFNMNDAYPQAAIDAGFNVFSLVNNHTNDQRLEGMLATVRWAEEKSRAYAEASRPVAFSGINKAPESGISYTILKKGSWKILFCAVTEILNTPEYRSYMNFVPYTEKGRANFLQTVKKIRAESGCDLFVLSLHSDEPEYIAPVHPERKEYYHQLLAGGVDIVWANHPHIIRERELVGSTADGAITKLIMYGNGNTISGQRTTPRFDNPSTPRDNTGDGFLWQATYSKRADSPPRVKSTTPIFITTYINDKLEMIVKKLDDDFAAQLEERGETQWADYIRQRKIISEEAKETTTWQENQ